MTPSLLLPLLYGPAFLDASRLRLNQTSDAYKPFSVYYNFTGNAATERFEVADFKASGGYIEIFGLQPEIGTRLGLTEATGARHFVSSFDRPNIQYRIVPKAQRWIVPSDFFGDTTLMSIGMPRSIRILRMAFPRSSKT